MKNNNSISNRYNIDIPLLSSVIALVFTGMLFIYSADNANYFEGQFSVFFKQLIALFLGLVCFVFFMLFNYQRLLFYRFWFYLFILFVLTLVLFIGVKIHGSRSWFPIIGNFSFQPSEIAKIFFIFIMASQIERFGEKIKRIPYLVVLMLIPIPIIGLILLQPDAGTAIVFIPITFFMLLVGGAKFEHLVFMILVGILSLTFALWATHNIKQSEVFLKNDQIDTMLDSSILFSIALSDTDIKKIAYPKLSDYQGDEKKKILDKKLSYLHRWFTNFSFQVSVVLFVISCLTFFLFRRLKETAFKWVSTVLLALSLGVFLSVVGQLFIKPHHIQRFAVVLDLDKDPLGASYHQRQSIIAIGSGGITGHGWRKGPQNNLDFIPEKTNDFIFAVIAEEWGFFRGTLLVFTLFTILLYRGLIIAYTSKDSFGVFIAVGVISMFFAHIMINLGMAIGLLPVMGLPLPFLSAGGSSLITNLVAIALLINISRRRFVC